MSECCKKFKEQSNSENIIDNILINLNEIRLKKFILLALVALE